MYPTDRTVASEEAGRRGVESAPATATTPPVAEPVVAADLRLDASAVAYRLYDVGYEIHLEQASRLFGASDPDRARPVRGEARAIAIPNLPVTLRLGPQTRSTRQSG